MCKYIINTGNQHRQCFMGIAHKYICVSTYIYICVWNNTMHIYFTYIFFSLLTFPFYTLRGILQMKLSKISVMGLSLLILKYYNLWLKT